MADLRVLLVDDSPDVRRLLSTRMELEGGFSVIDQAVDGAEAIVMATKHQPDLIVLDAMMPVLTGVDALPAIVKGSPSSKIVVYSAFTDDPALERIYDAGAHAVVNKSAPIDQLFLAISGVV
jgi:DNA-binding NarL/FixJ family response regulator